MFKTLCHSQPWPCTQNGNFRLKHTIYLLHKMQMLRINYRHIVRKLIMKIDIDYVSNLNT